MLDFSIKYQKNISLVLNSSELRDKYFYGIDIRSKDGQTISEDTWRFYIQAAQESIEKEFGIKLKKQVYNEDISYDRGDFEQFGFIRTTYPVNRAIGLNGFVGTIKQIQYPEEWLSNKKSNDKIGYYRQMYIVPNQNAARTGTLVYNGIVPYIGILGYSTIPNYWNVSYLTGFDKVPNDLVNIVGMMASLGPFGIMGDLIFSNPGISSQSLSIDGLSQSLSGVANANGNMMSGRIKSYIEQIQNYVKVNKTFYKGIVISAL